ncbi:hypothetical protein HZ326_11014 [Fusarium oxysporum f. sp. albedinis]|nr:hypothetical protein HZ326_11014 [Fusarium oxysporum f. sp. albedinis]
MTMFFAGSSKTRPCEPGKLRLVQDMQPKTLRNKPVKSAVAKVLPDPQLGSRLPLDPITVHIYDCDARYRCVVVPTKTIWTQCRG